MKSKVITMLMLLMTGFSAQAQTISGKLVDEENGSIKQGYKKSVPPNSL